MLNARYRELKKQYDEISVQIRELYAKQRAIRDKMAKACTHKRLDKVEPDPFLMNIGVDEEETRYKCRDCFGYFTEEEIKKQG